MRQGSVAALGQAIAEGETSSRRLVTEYLARVERLDGLFGSIRALVADALEQADASDEHRRRHGPRSALEGIPVVIKDNIDVAGQPTTAGSVALAASMPATDAHLVRQLREAGAVILAKTNLSELANFLTEGMPSGYSSLGGQVLNPYDLALTPSGSSSGTATAVALDLAPLGVGTETDGSIISPAVHQSLVGVKPTLGLVSRHGIVPIAPSQDTAGPMAGTVADAAALLAAMAGPDPADEATMTDARPEADSLTSWVRASDVLVDARFVIVRPNGGRTPIDSRVVDALRAAGAQLVEAAQAEPARDDEMFVLHYEFAPAFDAYLAHLGDGAPIRCMAELQEWNNQHAEQALKYGQRHVDEALAVDHAATHEQYVEARRRDRETVTGVMQTALGDADALVFRGDEGASWAARAGWPSICLPIGYSSRSRRPLGVTIVARAWSDARLLALAGAVEERCGSRLPPFEVNPAVFSSRGL